MTAGTPPPGSAPHPIVGEKEGIVVLKRMSFGVFEKNRIVLPSTLSSSVAPFAHSIIVRTPRILGLPTSVLRGLDELAAGRIGFRAWFSEASTVSAFLRMVGVRDVFR